MAEETSTTRRVVTGAVVGAAITGSLSSFGATPQQRVALPAGLGLLMAVVLNDERSLGIGVMLGAATTGGLLSRSEGAPALEYLPENLRPGNIAETVRRTSEERRRSRDAARRGQLVAKADRLLAK